MLYARGDEKLKEYEREMYLLKSKSKRFKRLVENTKEIIHQALKKEGEWIISFSGGKDSTVLADLLSKCGFKGDGIYFYYSKYENPDENTKQVKWANEYYGYNIKTVKCYGSHDAWKEVGHFFNIPTTDIEKIAAKKCCKDFKEQSERFMANGEYENIFMGLCKDESRARQISLNIKGKLYQTKFRCGWTCCPLADWTASDIWAYIVSEELPYLSVYDLSHWNREKIRNELTVLYCPDLVLKGEFLQFRMAYPNLFAEMCKEFPQIREYV
jgi:phosphoadenosine phosphosulfate reductase